QGAVRRGGPAGLPHVGSLRGHENDACLVLAGPGDASGHVVLEAVESIPASARVVAAIVIDHDGRVEVREPAVELGECGGKGAAPGGEARDREREARVPRPEQELDRPGPDADPRRRTPDPGEAISPQEAWTRARLVERGGGGRRARDDPDRRCTRQ